MHDVLPTAFITGMGDPRAWAEAVAARLAVQPPLVAPEWWQQPNGAPVIHIQQRGSREVVTLSLTPEAEQVMLEVWTTLWEGDFVLRFEDYHLLVTWVGRMLMHPDPEAAQLRLVVESYEAAQSAL